MIFEKVLFIYTSLIREGMPANGLLDPEPLLLNIDKSKLHIIAVTTSIITRTDASYWHEVDITFEGMTMISPEHDGKSTFNILSSKSLANEQYFYTACFNIHGVMLSKPGIYTASVSIYDNDEQGNKRTRLDTIESKFIVAGEM